MAGLDNRAPRDALAAAQFHVLSFEGPDAYARAGGIAARVVGLASAIAEAGADTHLWFVGDPELPGHERRDGMALHRWCQWISAYHPRGVYDGQEGKVRDYASSLPPFLLDEVLLPHLATPGARGIVLAEEWQTVDAVLHLDKVLRQAGLRERVRILWNANNTFGFDRIDWSRLSTAALLTTVSRYMRLRMVRFGVDPLVVPNGLPAESFQGPSEGAAVEFSKRVPDRLVLAKVARWDPAKRWLLAIDTTAELKRLGARPLLIARGGVEPHGGEVKSRAQASGLRLVERRLRGRGEQGLLGALAEIGDADVLLVEDTLDHGAKALLFRASSAVLAHSGHEPFGLVGLEAMAVAGLACTGATGEDYAISGWNALQLQSADPRDFVCQILRVLRDPDEEHALRRNGLATAHGFAWPRVLATSLFPALEVVPSLASPTPGSPVEAPWPVAKWRRARYPRSTDTQDGSRRRLRTRRLVDSPVRQPPPASPSDPGRSNIQTNGSAI
jgi:glycosyltransferase involved in cell wall biosynthesis